MRHLLTWLLVFGVLAGLNARVLATQEMHHPCAHEQHDCSGENHASTGGEDHQHDDKCPPDHHHHCGTCLHHLPLTVENDVIHRLTAPEFSRSHARPESERTPDGPFSALDKPPLI